MAGFYWDFCNKYQLDPTDRQSFAAFNEKLKAKKKSEWQYQQAYQAILLYYDFVLPQRDGNDELHQSKASTPEHERQNHQTSQYLLNQTIYEPIQTSPLSLEIAEEIPSAQGYIMPTETNKNSKSEPAKTNTSSSDEAQLLTKGARWISVYDQLKSAIAARHYSKKTLQAYRSWIRKFQTFTQSKDPSLLTLADVKAFLSHLATEKKVAASTQNQAFNALLFLFKQILNKEFQLGDGVVRAKESPTFPWYYHAKKWIESSIKSIQPVV